MSVGMCKARTYSPAYPLHSLIILPLIIHVLSHISLEMVSLCAMSVVLLASLGANVSAEASAPVARESSGYINAVYFTNWFVR